MKKLRNLRREEIFNRWLDERRYKRFKETLHDYTARCDRGEVDGLGYDDFSNERSDTVGSETQRDDTPVAAQSSGNAGERPETVEPPGWGSSEPPPF